MLVDLRPIYIVLVLVVDGAVDRGTNVQDADQFFDEECDGCEKQDQLLPSKFARAFVVLFRQV